MANVDTMVPGGVYVHPIEGDVIFLARSGDNFIFSRGGCLEKELLFIVKFTSRVVSDVLVGASSYNFLGPERVIAKKFESLKAGDIVLVDTKENFIFRVCTVQSINHRRMTIICDGAEINIQTTEVYKTNY